MKKHPFMHLSLNVLPHLSRALFTIVYGSIRNIIVWCQWQVVISLSWKKEAFLHPLFLPSTLKVFFPPFTFILQQDKTEISFQFIFSPLTFLPFSPLFSGALEWEGGYSWVGTAALSAVRWRTSQGQRERGSRVWMGVSSAASLH